MVKTFRESGCTETEYAQYLKGQYEWAQKLLSAANVKFLNGRESHDVARLVMNTSTEYYEDLVLTHGQFNAFGKLVRFEKGAA